jgi:hypothetical protein
MGWNVSIVSLYLLCHRCFETGWDIGTFVTQAGESRASDEMECVDCVFVSIVSECAIPGSVTTKAAK